MIVLSEDGSGNLPNAADALAYYNAVDNITVTPVTADPVARVLDATPWTGAARPGKCVLSPEMVMIACYDGEDDTAGFDAIRANEGL